MPNPTVYLSYPYLTQVDLTPFSSSEELGGEIYKRLKSLGIDVFYDKNVRPGENWSVISHQKLNASDFVVVLLTSDTLSTSSGVQAELRSAFDIQKRIIPILVTGFSLTKDIPAKFEAIQHLKGVFLDVHDMDDALEQVVTTINAGKTAGRFGCRLRLRNVALGVILSVLGVLLAFLALFPERTRTQWFCRLRVISDDQCQVTPTPLPTTQAAGAASNTSTPPTDAPVSNTSIPTSVTMSATEYVSSDQVNSAVSSSYVVESNLPIFSNVLTSLDSLSDYTVPSEDTYKEFSFGFNGLCEAKTIDSTSYVNVLKNHQNITSPVIDSLPPNTPLRIRNIVSDKSTIWYGVTNIDDEYIGWLPAQYILPSIVTHSSTEEKCPLPILDYRGSVLDVDFISSEMTMAISADPTSTLGFLVKSKKSSRFELKLRKNVGELDLRIVVLLKNYVLFQSFMSDHSQNTFDIELPLASNYLVVISGIKKHEALSDLPTSFKIKGSYMG